MDKRTVVLYGRSLLLSGLAASLGRCPQLRILHATVWAEAGRLLAQHAPDVLIFDLTHAAEGHMLPLLLANPGLLLIGLDAECNRALLVSGQEATSLTLNEIQQIVEGR